MADVRRHGESNTPIDLEAFLRPTESDEPIDLDETQRHLLDTDDERFQTADEEPTGPAWEQDALLSHFAESQPGSRDEPPAQPELAARQPSGPAVRKDSQRTTDNDVTRNASGRPPRRRDSDVTWPPSSAVVGAASQPAAPTSPSTPGHKAIPPPLPRAPNIQIDTAVGEPSDPGGRARMPHSSVPRSTASSRRPQARPSEMCTRSQEKSYEDLVRGARTR